MIILRNCSTIKAEPAGDGLIIETVQIVLHVKATYSCINVHFCHRPKNQPVLVGCQIDTWPRTFTQNKTRQFQNET